MEKVGRAQSGQTLVILLFAMVGLLAMMGLAIDGSIVFLERRRMQNAGDAAALAGTRELAGAICAEEESDISDAAVWAKVTEYGLRNGVRNTSSMQAVYVKFDGTDSVVSYDPPVSVGNSHSGGDGVPDGAVGVQATANITRATYFLSLVGQPVGAASAVATAVTGPPLHTLSGGLRPLGLPRDIFDPAPGGGDGIKSGECVTITWEYPCKDADGNEHCTVEYLDEIHPHRGMLNLEYAWNYSRGEKHAEPVHWPRAIDPSGNDHFIQCWMQYGWPASRPEDGCDIPPYKHTFYQGDYIHAKPGAPPDVIAVVPIQEPFYVPVFDAIVDCDSPLMIPPGHRPACPTQGEYVYHIAGFAGVIVNSADDVDQGAKTVELCIEDLIFGEGETFANDGYQSGGSSGACATQAMVVVLID